MITIKAGNSYSTVEGLSSAQHSGLRKLLSYEVNPKAAHFTGGFVRSVSLLDKKGSFPTGLLTRVIAHLDNTLPLVLGDDEDLLRYRFIDCRRAPTAGGFYPLKGAYPWQIHAVCTAIQERRGIISATTGSGKSRVIQQLALSLGVKTLVVVPSLEIKRQLAETLKSLKNVRVENIDSKALQSLKDFDCLIIDEGHHVAAKTYQKLNKNVWQGIYYRFFLTATPFRNQANEQLLFEGIAGQVIYQLSYKDAVKNKYIVPVESYYIETPKIPTSGHTWAQVYSELVTNNEHRNLKIAELLLNLNAAGKSTLCLVKEIAHGERLAALTGLPFVNGQDEASRDYIRQFNGGEIKTLIGTTGVMGEGVDTRPCEFVVIAGLGKAKSAFQQQVGRAVRVYPDKESAKVIIFKDLSHKWTIKHFNAQKKILVDEYCTTSIKLD